ncbi:hypothetical protein LCGC14_3141330 [marine sediment metagenome]|uniref:Uncharacterized protein n=1 Tax=marine sediment metagenome TaxID=412755 RepID=A0A0F8WKP8_9ZZZZ
MYKRPTLEEFRSYVLNRHKRIGLRMLYNKFDVPDEMRPAYNRMWDVIENDLKGGKDAIRQDRTEKKKTKKTKKKANLK